jgi:hypothetical protein
MNAKAMNHTERRPAQSFYWATIDGLGWKTAGPLPAALLPVLADEIPIALEDVHAVCAPLDLGRLLVCACPRAALASADTAASTLVPDSLPDGVSCDAEAGGFNLLVGEFEPPPIRRARRARHLHPACACLICLVLIGLGFARRAHHASAAAGQAAKAADVVLSHLTPDKRENSVMEQVGFVRAAADAASRARAPADAAAGLEALLKSWPASITCKPQSVSVSEGGVSFGVMVEGDPAPFLKAFIPPPGTALDEPRITSVGPVTRLNLHLHPTGGTRP